MGSLKSCPTRSYPGAEHTSRGASLSGQWIESVNQSGACNRECGLDRAIGQSENAGSRVARMHRFAIIHLWPDWFSQSGMAGKAIGKKAPIRNTDCPICYGLYPLCFSTSFSSITTLLTSLALDKGRVGESISKFQLVMRPPPCQSAKSNQTGGAALA